MPPNEPTPYVSTGKSNPNSTIVTLEATVSSAVAAVSAEKVAHVTARINALHYIEQARRISKGKNADIGVPLAIDLLMGGCLRCLRVPTKFNPTFDMLAAKGIVIVNTESYRGCHHAVVRVCTDPKLMWLATLHSNGTLLLWEAHPRQQVLRIATDPIEQPLTPPINHNTSTRPALMAFSFDGNWFIHEYKSGLRNEQVLIAWRLTAEPDTPFQPIIIQPKQLIPSPLSLSALSFTKLNPNVVLLCCTNTMSVYFINIISKSVCAIINLHGSHPKPDEHHIYTSVTWSFDGKYLALCMSPPVVEIWKVESDDMAKFSSAQRLTISRTGKIIDTLPDQSKTYPPTMRQWETLKLVGLNFGPDGRIVIAWFHDYCFNTDPTEDADQTNILVPDSNGRPVRDLHIFELTPCSILKRYKILTCQVVQILGGKAHHDFDLNQSTVFFHSSKINLLWPTSQNFISYLSINSDEVNVYRLSESSCSFISNTDFNISTPQIAIGMWNASSIIASVDSLPLESVALNVRIAHRTAYDSRNWVRHVAVLTRTLKDEEEAKAKSMKEKAKLERKLAKQKQNSKNGDEDEEDIQEDEEEEEEVDEKAARKRAKEKKLYEERLTEFGKKIKWKVNSKLKSNDIKWLDLYMPNDAKLLYCAVEDGSVCVYDINGGRIVKTTEKDNEQNSTYKSVVWYGEGQLACFRGSRKLQPEVVKLKKTDDEDEQEEAEEENEEGDEFDDTNEQQEQKEDDEDFIEKSPKEKKKKKSKPKPKPKEEDEDEPEENLEEFDESKAELELQEGDQLLKQGDKHMSLTDFSSAKSLYEKAREMYKNARIAYESHQNSPAKSTTKKRSPNKNEDDKNDWDAYEEEIGEDEEPEEEEEEALPEDEEDVVDQPEDVPEEWEDNGELQAENSKGNKNKQATSNDNEVEEEVNPPTTSDKEEDFLYILDVNKNTQDWIHISDAPFADSVYIVNMPDPHLALPVWTPYRYTAPRNKNKKDNDEDEEGDGENEDKDEENEEQEEDMINDDNEEDPDEDDEGKVKKQKSKKKEHHDSEDEEAEEEEEEDEVSVSDGESDPELQAERQFRVQKAEMKAAEKARKAKELEEKKRIELEKKQLEEEIKKEKERKELEDKEKRETYEKSKIGTLKLDILIISIKQIRKVRAEKDQENNTDNKEDNDQGQGDEDEIDNNIPKIRELDSLESYKPKKVSINYWKHLSDYLDLKSSQDMSKIKIVLSTSSGILVAILYYGNMILFFDVDGECKVKIEFVNPRNPSTILNIHSLHYIPTTEPNSISKLLVMAEGWLVCLELEKYSVVYKRYLGSDVIWKALADGHVLVLSNSSSTLLSNEDGSIKHHFGISLYDKCLGVAAMVPDPNWKPEPILTKKQLDTMTPKEIIEYQTRCTIKPPPPKPLVAVAAGGPSGKDRLLMALDIKTQYPSTVECIRQVLVGDEEPTPPPSLKNLTYNFPDAVVPVPSIQFVSF